MPRAHAHLRRTSRGVSLIEALVALAVMAFGIMGVVAMQMSMRLNADVAKQRSEATRLAQQAIETRRAFTAIEATAGRLAFNDLQGTEPETIDGDNASFVRTVSVPDLGGADTKTVVVTVAWTDRANTPQKVQLMTAVTGTLPELGVSAGIAPVGNLVTRKPRNRHPAIPPAALDQNDGTSAFTPPGAGGMQWVFDNGTGFIVKTCPVPPACNTFNGRLLSGFIRFALSSSQPTSAMAEQPTAPIMAGIQAKVNVSSAPSDPNLQCFEEVIESAVAYYCAIEVDPVTGGRWSGRSELDGGGLSIASHITGDDEDEHKVCRYTPVRNAHPTVSSSFTNQEHPLNYLDVTESLANQNFLVIRAGDDDHSFTCPADDSSTPLVNGNTWHHQPSS